MIEGQNAFSNAVLCLGFTWQMVKTSVIKLWGVEDWNACDQIAFCALQMNAGYIHVMHA